MAADWSTIESLPQTPLLDLFANDPNRLASLSLDVAGIHFDWSKTHLTREAVAAFADLAKASGLAAKRDALFGGEVVNVTEGRAVEHTAERGEGNPESVAVARQSHARMRALIDAIEAEALGPIRHVLHIGIGGSALGPDLLVDALGRDSDRYDVAIVSNVDGVALEEVFKRFDPAATLLVVASKTFTTTETMLNATSALQWMTESGVEDPYGKVIALTANPEKAVEWGVDETRILPFAESVGGRYSLWSTIGFPAALGLGWDAFEELLEGAAEMDRHFRLTDLAQNAPALAAFADLYYTQVRHAETRAPFAYDERLRLLPSYLQQLEMESNGKGVTVDGQPVGRPTAAITWGGVGTDAQHAVFQLLHQGTHLVPVEFIAVIEPGDVLSDDHHRQLLLNAFAQGAALMKGKTVDDPARSYSGDRPSSTILLDTLDPRTLGALIAFYEHRVFVNGVLLGINSFDQFGVELGKEMAKAADQGGQDFDPSTEDLIKRAFGE
ncbi:glucose-6-phosphate isomerase [Sphingomonas yabuuchiae]|uniref:Glucose-6-phosphate isomerase n=1 Tax=Sphingomonas yabuuchiae TaxID=172044 RepID=A0A147IPT3_9SPHN|nr:MULTISPECIES: glucose-6-phosphate isomerase [Sphingomonas]KQO57807.1 glucose-6-phosphate isomerase [Sphingomonas sp. Leaf257]KTT97361.1 glucose-6-phosphate isomerase [Sphingomonas yabuuchiae]MBB4610175.1 glucose-6-phosphate isomerase [Sphingomonas yabuuchiae]MBN3560531.1 glucose-6-phosphate isomerase [Sphingomonas yabuuchiae]